MKKLEPIMPGQILQEEFMKPNGLSKSQLASYINVPANRIGQIIDGSREITTDSAIRLGRFFNMTPEFWLNLQTRYNIKMTQKEYSKEILAIPVLGKDLIL